MYEQDLITELQEIDKLRNMTITDEYAMQFSEMMKYRLERALIAVTAIVEGARR